MENKKTLVLSIVGVLVLVIAVVGVSFAMYSFTGTGSRENVIKTGSVSFTCDDVKTLNLTNEYPKTDALGSQTTEAVAGCVVNAQMNGAMTINYEIGFTDVNVDGVPATVTDNATYALGTDDVKFNISRNGTYILDTTATTGIKLNTIADRKGTLITEGYLLDSGSFTDSGNVPYEIKAWIADDYDLSHTTTDNNGVHTNNTTSQTISFKVIVVGAQA